MVDLLYGEVCTADIMRSLIRLSIRRLIQRLIVGQKAERLPRVSPPNPRHDVFQTSNTNFVRVLRVNEVRELLAAELRQGKTRLINRHAIVQGN